MAKSPKQIDPFTQKLWSAVQVSSWIQYRSLPLLRGITRRAHGHDGPAYELSSRLFMETEHFAAVDPVDGKSIDRTTALDEAVTEFTSFASMNGTKVWGYSDGRIGLLEVPLSDRMMGSFRQGCEILELPAPMRGRWHNIYYDREQVLQRWPDKSNNPFNLARWTVVETSLWLMTRKRAQFHKLYQRAMNDRGHISNLGVIVAVTTTEIGENLELVMNTDEALAEVALAVTDVHSMDVYGRRGLDRPVKLIPGDDRKNAALEWTDIPRLGLRPPFAGQWLSPTLAVPDVLRRWPDLGDEYRAANGLPVLKTAGRASNLRKPGRPKGSGVLHTSDPMIIELAALLMTESPVPEKQNAVIDAATQLGIHLTEVDVDRLRRKLNKHMNRG